jgi:hypothetical protein
VHNPVGTIYGIVGVILGFITFVACWIYSVQEWGFLLGVGLGWIPSFFVAIIAGFVGPALLFIGIIIFAVAVIGEYADIW